jgi:acyl-CoA thioesterase II
MDGPEPGAGATAHRPGPTPATVAAGWKSASDGHSADALLDLLDLEEIDRDLYRANFVFPDPFRLYGGQVAAQALRAAGLSVDPGRRPHSLHGYFLRAGDATRPMVFQVFRDRDGRSFTARRVVALQGGEVILNMSASFQIPEEGHDAQVPTMPSIPDPEESASHEIPRLFSFEGRAAPQPYPGMAWPTRFWARCTAPLNDDPLLHACALTYLSDISTGLSLFRTATHAPSSSLDHAVWFHRPIDANDWMLSDLVPHTASGGRGWYTGSIYDRQGVLLASVAQESLFRRRRPQPETAPPPAS